MEARWRYRIMDMADKVSGEDRGGRAPLFEMRDNRDEYRGRGDTGWQQKICGMTDMAKWVGRTVADWENINRERLPT